MRKKKSVKDNTDELAFASDPTTDVPEFPTQSKYDVPRPATAATLSSSGFKNPLYEGMAAQENPLFVSPDFATEAPMGELENPYESLDDYVKGEH